MTAMRSGMYWRTGLCLLLAGCGSDPNPETEERRARIAENLRGLVRPEVVFSFVAVRPPWSCHDRPVLPAGRMTA